MRVLRQHLDDEQLEIARASDRSLLVIAGPGSGKTHLLAHTAAYHVRKSHPARWRVLCLTFSVEAAKQMRTRLADAAMELPSQRRIEVANFHQLGSRLLGHHGHHVGWPRDAQTIDIDEAREIARASALQVGLPALSGRDAFDAIQRVRNERTVPDSVASSERLQSLRATYQAHPEAQGPRLRRPDPAHDHDAR